MKLISGCIFVLFLFAIAGAVSAQEMSLLTFGKGKIQVRLYTDYFCGPCSNLEPKIEYLLTDLIRRDIIAITFVDVPFHKYSSFYAKYFLYILNEKKEISHILKARATLFEAARNSIYDQDNLETFLQKKGFSFKTFDTKPVFNILQHYLQEDQINSTPTCVILDGKRREIVSGSDNIAKALEKLK
jgi:hypothetical protein